LSANNEFNKKVSTSFIYLGFKSLF